MKDKIKNNKCVPYIIILIVSVIISIPLFNKNLNIEYDDGIQHLCRIIENYVEILNGNASASIFSRQCNNFGYCWNVFYSPLTSFLPLIFRLFTNSFIVMLKMFLGTGMLLSGITMYMFLNKLTKNKYIGTLGAIIYMLAPYHLSDMYLRIAVSEFISFIFLPLVFLGIYNIFNENKKRDISLIIGASGLILTHTILTVITAAFCAIYVLINIKKLKQKNIVINLILNIIFILLLTVFFTLPLLQFKNATTYEVFKENRMATVESYNNSKITISELIYKTKDTITFNIGFVTIIGLLLTPFAIKKIDQSYKKEYILFLIFGILSAILTLKIIPFNIFRKFVCYVQFAWRMLEFLSFFLSIIAAINFGILMKKFNFIDVIMISLIGIISVSIYTKNFEYENYYDETDLYESAISVNEHTLRVHAGCASFEYLPQKAFKNLDYIKTREDTIYLLRGSTEITEYEKNIEQLNCKIHANENSKLELPYIYYPGYTVTFETAENTIILENYETENGFVGITLDEGTEGIIYVKYTGTVLMNYTKIISLITLIILIIYILNIDKKIYYLYTKNIKKEISKEKIKKEGN